MLQFWDFPSYRLRHGIRVWRYRRLRRKVWRRLEMQYANYQGVPRPINLRLAVILGIGSVLAFLTSFPLSTRCARRVDSNAEGLFSPKRVRRLAEGPSIEQPPPSRQLEPSSARRALRWMIRSFRS